MKHPRPEDILEPGTRLVERLGVTPDSRQLGDLTVPGVIIGELLAGHKVMEYLKAGTLLVWAVEPRLRLITVYAPDHSARVYTEAEEIEGGDVLPGFRVRAGTLFE